MADWTHQLSGGGETNDAQMERMDVRRTSAVTVGTTRVSTGGYGLDFPLSTAGANCTVPATGLGVSVGGNSHFYQAQIGLSTTPSSALGLLCTYASPTTERFVTIGTDRLVRVYDSAGNQVGHTSRDTISSSGLSHFAILYDFLIGLVPGGTGAANKAYMCVWIDQKVQWDGLVVVASGDRLLPTTNANDLVWGEDLDAGVDRGCIMYMDDWDADSTTGDSRYMPHVTARPLCQVIGASTLPPTAVGTHTAWSNDYASVDDYPNDGAGTISGSVTNSAKETYTYSAANPTDSGDTIHNVAMPVVKTETAGAKSTCSGLMRDASANESTIGWSASGTSYLGDRKTIARPAGGSWVYTDFDLTAGVSNLQFGMQSPSANAGSNITSLPGPEITKWETRMSNGRCFN